MIQHPLPYRPTVLAVDDTPENLEIIKGVLTPEYQVKIAVSGKTALKISAAKPPDIILLDIMMPEMDGYEVCRQLKSNTDLKDIPIIFVTALGHESDELKGLKMGAIDYISKPISPPILKARIDTHLALRQIRIELQKKNHMLQVERELMENIVVKMRTSIHFDRRYLRSFEEPQETTNGDILLSAFRPDGGQHLLLGDFTGHGLPAAIGGPLIANIFYTRTKDGLGAEKIMAEMNSVLIHQLPTTIFMAAIMVEVSPTREMFKIWNAAVPGAVLLSNSNSPIHFKSSMPALGIIEHLQLDGEDNIVPWVDGARLYLFSDGFNETINSDGEMFGEKRMEHLLTQLLTTNNSLDFIAERVKQYSGTNEQEDDMTLAELQKQ